MSATATERRLLRLSKLPRAHIELLKEGVSLETALARPVDDAMAQAVADRLALAEEFLSMAEVLVRSRSNMWRAAIARYYYAMYHAMRAASFQDHGGDDHEQHTTLSQRGVPSDFPNRALRINELRAARALRNEADYDPYPANSAYFKTEAKSIRPTARAFVTEVRNYLRAKGNPHV